MDERILIAGFGGQGILSMGKMLVDAAMAEGSNVSWLPSYGPEMRGGTSNVSVNISNDEIGAPTIAEGDATCVIVMNLPSLVKFEHFVEPGGMLFINSSIIDKKATRTDIKTFYVPVNDIAKELGNNKIANMVMLGAYIAKSGVVKEATMLDYVKKVFGTKKPEMVALNEKALQMGAEKASH